ncbi:Hsp20/alpha crystallin family protein [Schnuerera sp. xch1]|uniref:Hsp20/alpha crystallin family protein n=1 Tax=Schnuerera sp. xch1 TaxID=2874283 RepID=UPI001CBF60E1|nr:Hsp20/alpha crystallin family protein [Schnuerera sp. xch1]MBZ2175428.1 Hsp20/alpha crystallin family protein [Schnuerera sp. xch1]
MFGIRPYRERRNLSKRWMSNFDDILNSMFDSMLEEFDYGLSSYYPMKVDIKEVDNRYLLEAELPGIDKEEINIEIKDDVLTISVENKEEIKEERENYIRRERRYGSFRRSFCVEGIDQDNIHAKFENGILHLELPKDKNFSSKGNKISIE